jgi:hypothetical protein
MFVGIVGKEMLEKAFAKSLKAIEAQKYNVSSDAKA